MTLESIDLEPFVRHINRKIALSDEEQKEFLSFFKTARVKKRQFVVQPNFVAKYRYYVLTGGFRGYVVREHGEESTIQFAIDDWWISDYNSYIYQQPATMFVLATEDSTVLQIDHESESKLKALHHKFETFFRITAERSTAFMQRRIITNLTKDAEHRYEEFEAKYPALLQRMPQYAVASYLGMTTEYLSKLRNKRVDRKS